MATISSGNNSGLSSLSACVDDTNSVGDGNDSDLDAVMLEASQWFKESILAEEKHCDYADGGDSDLDALLLSSTRSLLDQKRNGVMIQILHWMLIAAIWALTL